MPVINMTRDEWMAEGQRRFGGDFMKWKFACPMCGNIAEVSEYRPFAGKGVTPSSATSECIGRHTGVNMKSWKQGKHPCDYAGYGLFRMSPVRVTVTGEDGEPKEIHCFAFADVDAEAQPCAAQ